MAGIMLGFREELRVCVSRAIASGPRCLRCLILRLSGPVELLFRACFIASDTLASVMHMGVLDMFLIFLCSFRFVLLVLCKTVLVNCLLKASVFCLLVMAVRCPKVMVVLLWCFCFLLVRPAMVFQSLWVLYLWSHPSVMCSFHISSLCLCIVVSI